MLDGKHAVVTGGSTGIGLAIAKRLVSKGARVTIASRNAERLRRSASESDGMTPIVLDVSDPESVASAFDKAGPVDTVNCVCPGFTDTVLLLCKHSSRSITGQAIVVAGGEIM